MEFGLFSLFSLFRFSGKGDWSRSGNEDGNGNGNGKTADCRLPLLARYIHTFQIVFLGDAVCVGCVAVFCLFAVEIWRR